MNDLDSIGNLRLDRTILPIGATVAVGYKDPARGFPTEKDRFFIMNARADGKGKDGRRYRHPDFGRFNDMARVERNGKPAANPESTKIRGTIVHTRQEDCLTRNLQAQKLPDGNGKFIAEPHGAPACKGDGVKAKRWSMKDGKYLDIPCPDRLCPFRQRPQSGAAPCSVLSYFLFQLRWPEKIGLPTPLVQYASRGWEVAGRLEGLFEYVRQQAAQLGLDPETISFYGLPFVMTLEERTGSGSRFPVVVFAPDFPPGSDLQSWLMAQSTQRRQLVDGYAAYTTVKQIPQEIIAEVVNDLSAPGAS